MLIKQMVATETTQPPRMAGKVVWEEEALCLAKRTALPVEEYDVLLLKWLIYDRLSNCAYWYSKAKTQPSEQ